MNNLEKQYGKELAERLSIIAINTPYTIRQILVEFETYKSNLNKKLSDFDIWCFEFVVCVCAKNDLPIDLLCYHDPNKNQNQN